MSRRKRSSTEWMLEAVASTSDVSCPNFPPEFLCGLRGALDAGLSCEEITAMLVLFTGVYEAAERLTGAELIERAVILACSMCGDVEFLQREREQTRRNKRYASTLIRRGKRRK